MKKKILDSLFQSYWLSLLRPEWNKKKADRVLKKKNSMIAAAEVYNDTDNTNYLLRRYLMQQLQIMIGKKYQKPLEFIALYHKHFSEIINSIFYNM
jgi:hypothetical protein